jgi:glycosyltransferase involved in cell wall biosynthesis
VKNISAVLITYNEEDKIETALRSVAGVADEIVVVDSFSSDATAELCRRYPVRLIQRVWPGYCAQKQFAADQACFDWILSLDADEKLSLDLHEEIKEWKRGEEGCEVGYRVPRMTYFMGRWIRHTTWYPDWQLRLFRKSKGCWVGGRIHESVQVHGAVGTFSGHLLHCSYSSVSEYLKQLERFSALAAADYFDGGTRVGLLRLGLYPPLLFFKNFVLRAGFLDGLPGFVVSFLAGVSAFFKYLKLWEMQHRETFVPWEETRDPRLGCAQSSRRDVP